MIRLWISHIDDTKVTPSLSSANCNTRIVSSWPVFTGRGQDILYLMLLDPMPVNVRVARLWVNVKSCIHGSRQLGSGIPPL